MNLRMLTIDMPEGNELLAIAKIAIDPSGEFQISLEDIVDAPVRLTMTQKARALRMLATGIEAEAIGRAAEPSEESTWHS